MSNAARIIPIVTDDFAFSGQISELMLRAGARTLRFASSRDALDMTRASAPDLVLLHMLSAQVEAAWECYAALRADSATATIPILLYAPPCEQERAVGAAAPGVSAHAERILAQTSVLLHSSEPDKRWFDDEQVQSMTYSLCRRRTRMVIQEKNTFGGASDLSEASAAGQRVRAARSRSSADDRERRIPTV